MACSDVKVEEIIPCCQIGGIYPFVEMVLPGAGFMGDLEPSLGGAFFAFQRVLIWFGACQY